MHPQEERTRLSRLEAARQVYNVCLGAARKRARLVREPKAFRRARDLSREDPERKRLFAQALVQHACSDYAPRPICEAVWALLVGEHLDSHTMGKAGLPRPGAVDWRLLGSAKRVRFRGRHQSDSVEGKVNTSGIRWCGDRVEWTGLVLPALLDQHDLVVAHGRSCPVKYARLVRRKLTVAQPHLGPTDLRGTPYRKPQHPLTSGDRESGASDRARWRWSLSRQPCSSRSASR